MSQEGISKRKERIVLGHLLLGKKRTGRGLYHADYLAIVGEYILDWLF